MADCSCTDGWLTSTDGLLPCPICNAGDPPRLPSAFASHIHPPAQRGSIRPVTVKGVTTMCEVRTIRGYGLRPGDPCWVEFGAIWRGNQRQPGTWKKCRVLKGRHEADSGVTVELFG